MDNTARMETLQAALALHHPDTIAKRVGVSRQAVLRWEQGSIPREQYRRPLARALGMSKAELETAIEGAKLARLQRSRTERHLA